VSAIATKLHSAFKWFETAAIGFNGQSQSKTVHNSRHGACPPYDAGLDFLTLHIERLGYAERRQKGGNIREELYPRKVLACTGTLAEAEHKCSRIGWSAGIEMPLRLECKGVRINGLVVHHSPGAMVNHFSTTGKRDVPDVGDHEGSFLNVKAAILIVDISTVRQP
jgi:hypothetical protein